MIVLADLQSSFTRVLRANVSKDERRTAGSTQMGTRKSRQFRVGILDNTGSSLGGAQLVNTYMASLLSREHDVEIVHSGKGYGLEELERAFGVDLTKVRERRMRALTDGYGFGVPGPRPLLHQIWNSRELTRPYDLFIYSGHNIPPICSARHGLVYCHFPFDLRTDEAWETDPRWIERTLIDRRARAIGYRLLRRVQIAGYRRILTNSFFTARWIEHRWGKPSEVVYPPVELDLPRRQKRNLIVSIGRFTSGRRRKNQLEQVEAFRQFLVKCSEDWSFSVIGSCAGSSEDETYLDLVKRAGQELPISFLVNVDRKVICSSLAEAKLFWHTTGLNVNEEERPAEVEHFGIATVEAMRAGCVPIVIDGGGQREIIENGVSGFLSQDMDGLIVRSIDLAHDGRALSVMSEHARRRSMVFTREVFDRRIKSIVSECLNH